MALSHCPPKRKDHTPSWGGVRGNEPAGVSQSGHWWTPGRGTEHFAGAGRKTMLENMGSSRDSPGRMGRPERDFHRRGSWGAWREAGGEDRQRREIEAELGENRALSYQQREVWVEPVSQLITCHQNYQHLPANWL